MLANTRVNLVLGAVAMSAVAAALLRLSIPPSHSATLAEQSMGSPRTPTPRELLEFATSPDPRLREISKQVSSGPARVRLERTAARQAGIVLSTSDLPRRSLASAENAAPAWRAFHKLLQSRPIDQKWKVSSGLSPGEAAQLLAKRADLYQLLNRAASRPECDFARDWSQGAEVFLPEYPSLRTAAYLVNARTRSLTSKRQWNAAIDSQAQGFRIARHGASDPVLISYLVGNAIRSITLRGFEELMVLAANQPETLDRVVQVVEVKAPRLDGYRSLSNEGMFFRQAMERLRTGGPAAALEFAPEPAAETHQPLKRLEALTPAERKVWTDFVDAAEAAYLQSLRKLVSTRSKNFREQRKVVDELDRELKSQPINPVNLYAAIQLPVFGKATEAGVQVDARQAITIAAARVLAYHARRGRWPSGLEEATKTAPSDPFSEQPIRYRREPLGFVVYSVGAAGSFNGGQSGQAIPRTECGFRFPHPGVRAP